MNSGSKPILIAHRGNLSGPDAQLENAPDHVQGALDQGFDAEIDVWVKNGEFFLGHDAPIHHVSREFILKDGLWCHAKNRQALEVLLSLGVHCFFHDRDDFTLTSRGFIWTYIGKEVGRKSIAVMPELALGNDMSAIFRYANLCEGICSDWVRSLSDLKGNPID